MKIKKINIKKNYFKEMDYKLLALLLKDQSSGRNIIWATNNHSENASNQQEITLECFDKKYSNKIKPRITKNKKEQQLRIKNKAEVFTPSYICNKQNNLIDNAWFGYENVFNVENDKIWITNKNKIFFLNNKTWKDYVKLNRMEISCGEAPYLVSRYDTTTGEFIDINNRIGILDRKIRIINENIEDEAEWVEWVYKAFQATYGYEWQGDSLLIARQNLLFSFIDYYLAKFHSFPIKKYLLKIARIISWNIFQMDGLKFVIPNSCKSEVSQQMILINNGNEWIFNSENLEEKYVKCQGCLKNDKYKHNGIYCKIMDWDKKHSIKFISLFKKEKK